MRLKSSSGRYGAVPIAVHWATAAAVLVMLASGFRAAGMEDAAGKAALLRVHVVLGLTVLALTIGRLAWWWLIDRKPAAPAGLPGLQAKAASGVHALLYVAILAMAASGVGMLILSGAGAVLFAGSPAPLPDFLQFPPRLVHGIVAKALMALIVGHVLAALYHQFVRRDRLLARMGLGRASVEADSSAASEAVSRSRFGLGINEMN